MNADSFGTSSVNEVAFLLAHDIQPIGRVEREHNVLLLFPAEAKARVLRFNVERGNASALLAVKAGAK